MKKISVLAKNHGYFNSVLPEKYVLGDWIDLKAGKTMQIRRGEYVNIPLGVAMKLPIGYEAHVLPRSSTFRKYHILMANSMGIIDNSYCGRNDEWCFPAFAVADTVIARGDRIAQFRIVKNQPKIELIELEDLTQPDRNGFGSSGVR
uniref:dUTP diphosphatase n=1 Tax=Podoviridae sp. ct2nF21 TaxID=2826537 RepID=A0A8S5NGW1_9CAUD|nr:MAG TPA: dUTPase [Podoviridae sp. ct2nF21]